MAVRCKVAYCFRFWLSFFLLLEFISPGASSTQAASTPPENYKGPIAERPIHRAGDYWIYERADLTKVTVKTGAPAQLEFPLWVGKTWNYQGEALRAGQPRTSKASRLITDIQCHVIRHGKITVGAGAFEAFECNCQCTVHYGRYEPDCGQWTIWYAPEVRNIIKIKTEDTATSMQLVEHKTATTAQPTSTKPVTRPGLKAEKPEWRVGYEWRYAWKRPGRSGTYTSEIIREDLLEGIPAYVIKREKNEDYYAKDVLGMFARMSGGKLVFKRNNPRQNFLWPLEVGKEWRNAYLRENIQEKSSETFDYRMVVAQIEEVTVPAGTFEAFKVEVYIHRSGNLFAEYWYSPQVKWLVMEREHLRDGLREVELISFKAD